MPNYLTKEEIKQWRSSLEKITLEEFAARLGKQVEESKSTNDVVDIVMSKGTSSNTGRMEDGFSRIAERAFERERQISHTPFSISGKDMVQQKNNAKTEELNKKLQEMLPSKKAEKKAVIAEEKMEDIPAIKKDVQIILKKSLTDREQMVFEYLINNIGKTVYAKDLATLLDLPRDYVYKYIKNLRAKIEGDKLKNVPSGGFVLTE
ncbi:helix-turn-helix domain-containing protein [bacterium]|nr:helix-turn-helix domain-containing protein [bacterium]